MLRSIYIATQGLINNQNRTSLGIASQGLLLSGFVPPISRSKDIALPPRKNNNINDDNEVFLIVKTFLRLR